MLENIFLIQIILDHNSSKIIELNSKFQSPFGLKSFLAYPDEDLFLNQSDLLERIISNQKAQLKKKIHPSLFSEEFLFENSKAIRIDEINLLLLLLPHNYILGLIFDFETNPYDFRNEVIKLMQEYFLKKFYHNIKTQKISNLLLMLFIDLRKFEDESLVFQESHNNIMIINNKPIVKVFVYGLDNAGKTSLMRLLATGKFDFDYFPPTKKFRITNVKLESGIKLILWDMPGQRIFRENWLRGAQASNLLLFVLDSADEERFAEAKEEFWNILNLFELQGVSIAFLLNKIDLIKNGNIFKKKIIEYFELDKIIYRDYELILTSLPQRIGIDGLLLWMDEKVDILLLQSGLKK